jgi:aminoglycoside phosphotransferase (APT) family kinase protein
MSETRGQGDEVAPREICGILERLGLIAKGEQCFCEPLSGGVSSDIWRIEIGERRYCLKRALPRLRVAQLWEAPVERNRYEWQWIEVAGRIGPEAVPRLVARDEQAGLFVMEYLDPAEYPAWKAQLRDGVVENRTAEKVAERLARIHSATARRDEIARAFATDASFYAIRLEPYLVATARVHPDLADRLERLVEITAQTKRALVHGDVSPKNILVGPRGPIFIDAECAWYGDPAFDAAFCLNHLLLKCVWRPQHARALLVAFERWAEVYLDGVTWESRAAIEARIAHLLPALSLARIDGKSPVEYLTEPKNKDIVRVVARELILEPRERLHEVRQRWSVALQR